MSTKTVQLKNPDAPASEKQVNFLTSKGIDVPEGTTVSQASALISAYIAEHPFSEEETAERETARKANLAQFNEKLKSQAATEKQVAMVSRITRGKYVPTNRLQVQVFMANLKRRRAAEPVAA